MKINKENLRKMIRESVERKLEKLFESNDFTAKRKIVLAAKNTSMEFEKDIVQLLNLVDPDQMPPNIQDKYYEVVSSMEDNIVEAVSEAVRKLTAFPRKENQGGQ